MRKLAACIGAALIAAVAGCTGGTASPVPTATPTPEPVTFHQSGGSIVNPPDITYVVQSDGLVTKTLNGSSVSSAKLTAAETAKVYVDVQNAMPLSTLPASSVPDFSSIVVSWQGQTSPDIFGDGNAKEDALLSDLSSIEVALP